MTKPTPVCLSCWILDGSYESVIAEEEQTG